ncbi:MAG: penicillin-binding protein 1C [Microscillaceae bacterium]|nr:penicillin-binding protein 1C [Microscillaceae bacterium]MDW8461006.1 penicillin-binding protein 1C [Cytophagales bacterium]
MKKFDLKNLLFQALILSHYALAQSQIIYKNSIFYITSPFKQFFLSFLVGIFIFLAIDRLFPVPLQIEYSTLIVAKNNKVIHAFLTKDQKWRLRTELHEITPMLKKAILFKEDKWFYYHIGINPIAIIRAGFYNLWTGKRTSGASTITMQVARLLEPKPRTYWNKIVEMFRALQLEYHLSKEEILQLYLNLVPYGGNIEGVKSASLFFLGKMPKQLSLAQITTLAIVPNRPTSLRLGKDNFAIIQARNQWLKIFAQNRLFDNISIENALKEDLPAKRRAAPQEIPHLAYRLRRQFPEKLVIPTYINPDVQDRISQMARNYLQRIKNKQIYNISVLVVNNKSRAVEGYLGSADFYDKDHEGEVDGILAVRSPGSTLKSFLYAVAFDQGLLTPKTQIADVPTELKGFQPENFYKNFNGNVSIEKALIASLNIPAVKTLENLGVQTLIEKLKKAHFKQIAKDEKKLGLSMILGGCGATLEELTNLYVSFAQKGFFQPLKYVRDSTKKNEKIALISPAAAFAITDILSKATRPDLPNNLDNIKNKTKIAWKTGTSYGKRDAWSIGYNTEYTVGVWVGNFKGGGEEEIVGAEVATPLLFEILNGISSQNSSEWFTAPPTLRVRWVCAETGLVPNTFCQDQIIDVFQPLVSNTQLCQHLREVKVSLDEKTSYCLSCLPHGSYQTKLYPNISPELAAFYEVQGKKYLKIPPHNPKCPRISQEEAPIITSPSADKEYIIDRYNPPEILLSCKTRPEVKQVYWYLNDTFYQSASPSQGVFFKPQAGELKISCTDDRGNSSSLVVKILNE